jgi:hypothetical protein
MAAADHHRKGPGPRQAYDLASAHPPALTGQVVTALATDPTAIDRTGHVLIATDIATEHGLTGNPAGP